MLYEKKGRYIVEFQDIPTARQHQIEIDLEERRANYKEVELGFDEERALREAKRCLSCRRCLGCALCWAECKPEAINFEMEDEVFELEADEVILAPGVERPLDRIAPKFGLGKHLNVITDLQLERMLSESGPSAGLVIRPYDGEIPQSIAFVQAFDSAAPQMQQAALCFGINEAILVRRKLGEAEIQVFVSNGEAFLKEHASELNALDRIGISEAVLETVDAADNEAVRLTVGSNGSQEAKVFDLVVLMTQPQISKTVKDLGKSLGLTMAYANFLHEGARVISTEKESVGLASRG